VVQNASSRPAINELAALSFSATCIARAQAEAGSENDCSATRPQLTRIHVYFSLAFILNRPVMSLIDFRFLNANPAGKAQRAIHVVGYDQENTATHRDENFPGMCRQQRIRVRSDGHARNSDPEKKQHDFSAMDLISGPESNQSNGGQKIGKHPVD
jgi:hypothetical protein